MSSHKKRQIAVADAADMIFILVDVQQHFVDSATIDATAVVSRIRQMLLMAQAMKIPVIVTLEEPTDRKGLLVAELCSAFEDLPVSQTLTKLTYDLTATESIRSAIVKSGRKQVAVVGTETDVCILQSVLGLLRLDVAAGLDAAKVTNTKQALDVFVVEDCVLSSSRAVGPALARMYAAGAIPTTWKSLHYELVKVDDFENSLRRDKQLIRRGFIPPEELGE